MRTRRLVVDKVTKKVRVLPSLSDLVYVRGRVPANRGLARSEKLIYECPDNVAVRHKGDGPERTQTSHGLPAWEGTRNHPTWTRGRVTDRKNLSELRRRNSRLPLPPSEADEARLPLPPSETDGDFLTRSLTPLSYKHLTSGPTENHVPSPPSHSPGRGKRYSTGRTAVG